MGIRVEQVYRARTQEALAKQAAASADSLDAKSRNKVPFLNIDVLGSKGVLIRVSDGSSPHIESKPLPWNLGNDLSLPDHRRPVRRVVGDAKFGCGRHLERHHT